VGNRLAGKVCIITGSGGSMGRAAALQFAAQGALVVGCDMDDQLEAETRALVIAAGGAMASHTALDLTSADACLELAAFAADRYGRIDVLFIEHSQTFDIYWQKDCRFGKMETKSVCVVS